jgi:hypothetical protein
MRGESEGKPCMSILVIITVTWALRGSRSRARLAVGTCARKGERPGGRQKPRAGRQPRRRAASGRIAETLEVLVGTSTFAATRRGRYRREDQERSPCAVMAGGRSAAAGTWRRRKPKRVAVAGEGQPPTSTSASDPWMKAPKLSRVRVAAGQPVSTDATKGRGARPATSRHGCGTGPRPCTETLDVAAG